MGEPGERCEMTSRDDIPPYSRSMQAGYDNSMQCALFHMVHWVTAYKKASKGNLLSWENSWIQDLCQYYCYGVVVMPNKSKRPMPAWILDHFWNLSNNYCSNLIPTRFSALSKAAAVRRTSRLPSKPLRNHHRPRVTRSRVKTLSPCTMG